jgi:hypothetical protein
MPRVRTRSVGTKLTEAEYAAIQMVAGDRFPSEWVRATLLAAARPRPIEIVLLAEVLSLRTVLLNLHFAIASGQPLTADRLQGFIDRADAEKWLDTDARLRQARQEGPR